MAGLTSNLEQIAEDIRRELSARDAAREKVLPLCREMIRHSANAIRSLHRGEYQEAEGLLHIVHALLNDAQQILTEHHELYHAGFVHDAQKEYTEASATLALVRGKSLPAQEELGVAPPAYLNGLGEAVGELRRYLLDAMRKGDISRGEEILGAMDDIYNVLVTMDFPDVLTHGLRRTTDVVRGILEKTRGDLTLAVRQRDLGERLDTLEQIIGRDRVMPSSGNDPPGHNAAGGSKSIIGR